MELSLPVMLVVLASALLHAGWNGLIKSSQDKQLDTFALAAAGGALALAIAPWLQAPARESWPWLAGSVLIRIPYFLFLAGAYRWGDLSYTYPMMRGGGAMLVLVFGAVALGELLPAGPLAGVVLVCAGIMAYASGRHDRRATLFALGNAAVIASYTLVDAKGVRASGAPLAYTMWFFSANGLLMLAIGSAQHGPALARYVWRHPARMGAGGACMIGGYAVALWAMTEAPVALVAVLRETSVLFAACIGAIFFRERFTPRRVAATAAIFLGLAVLGATR